MAQRRQSSHQIDKGHGGKEDKDKLEERPPFVVRHVRSDIFKHVPFEPLKKCTCLVNVGKDFEALFAPRPSKYCTACCLLIPEQDFDRHQRSCLRSSSVPRKNPERDEWRRRPSVKTGKRRKDVEEASRRRSRSEGRGRMNRSVSMGLVTHPPSPPDRRMTVTEDEGWKERRRRSGRKILDSTPESDDSWDENAEPRFAPYSTMDLERACCVCSLYRNYFGETYRGHANSHFLSRQVFRPLSASFETLQDKRRREEQAFARTIPAYDSHRAYHGTKDNVGHRRSRSRLQWSSDLESVDRPLSDRLLRGYEALERYS